VWEAIGTPDSGGSGAVAQAQNSRQRVGSVENRLENTARAYNAYAKMSSKRLEASLFV
jgi:hypothetical protein